MSRKSYAETIVRSKLMLEAMKANKASLSTKLDDTFIGKFASDTSEAEMLNVQQEKLKAALKEQTAKLEATLKSMEKQYAEAKKRIKLDFPQEQWKEFGFDDKR